MGVPKQERLLSLDVFRGLTIAAMVLVNNPGSSAHVHPWLHHVSWDGWTIADLVFPFFLFIVGVAIPFSIDSRLARGVGHRAIVLNALRRSLILFAIGLVLNGFPKYDLVHLRMFGVLQRIAICYFVATLIYLSFKPRAHVLIAAGLLVFYFVLMKYVPVPGGRAGVLVRDGNWVQYIDLRLLAGHMQSPTFEGKGLLSTLPALATALVGLLVGQHLKSPAPGLEKAVNLYFWGTLGMLLGTVWSLSLPIIQNLWTSSLVLFMGGMATVVLASCYYVADIKNITWWTPPLLVFGTNAITVWTLDWFLRGTLRLITLTGADGKLIDLRTYLWRELATWVGPWAGSLLFAVAEVLFWLGAMSLLYRKKMFIKI
jgi:predicted acyltransferase